MNSLCSNNVVGSRMYSTGASRSFSSAMHSSVGATGAYTSKPPLFILITCHVTRMQPLRIRELPSHAVPAARGG